MGCGASQQLKGRRRQVGASGAKMARSQASNTRSHREEARTGASGVLARLVSRRQSLVKVDIGDGSQVSAAEKQLASAGEGPPRRRTSETIEFESYQQLCQQIVANKLLGSGKSRRSLLCLFMFSSQGSSMGELAFELVEHSGLMAELNNNKTSQEAPKKPCPLYYSIDVTSLVASNIDQRIRQYHQLKVGAAGRRKSQADSQIVDTCFEARNVERDLLMSSPTSSADNLSQSSSEKTILEDSISKQSVNGQDSGDFATLTLDTKQRSILHHKLIKYFNSVSAKWLLGLLQAEVERLETACHDHSITRPRVYLINLIPNQLTLFKSCLYLKQTLSLKEFVYPYTAIKFEKRTNLPVLRKERMVKKRAPSKKQSSFRLRLALFRLSFKRRKSVPDKPADKKDDGKKETPVVVVSEEPKLSDFFEEQFRTSNKLIKVRYKPIYGPNELLVDDNINHCGNSPWDTDNSEAASLQGLGQRLSEVSSATNAPARSISMIGLNYGGDTPTIPDHYGPLLSPWKVSVLSLSENSDCSLYRWPTSNAADVEPGPYQIPWAVELKLIYRKVNHSNSLSLQNLFHHEKQESIIEETNIYGDIVYAQKQTRSSSSQSGSTLLASLRTTRQQQYRLKPTKVVTNEAEKATSVIIEAKHVQPANLARLKNPSDVRRLAKRIREAKYLVSSDCQTWLYSAIDESHKITSSHKNDIREEPKPELVVYVISIDVNSINSASFKRPATTSNHTLAPSPRLQITTDSDTSLSPSPIVLKALSADGRRSCRSLQTRSPANKGSRHVQFRLRKRPEASQFESLQAEHRHWLEEHVFVSWPMDEDLYSDQTNYPLVALSILATTLDLNKR